MAPLERGSSVLVPSVRDVTEAAYPQEYLDGVWDDATRKVVSAIDKCPNCGAQAELVRDQNYLGGVGYVWTWRCADSVACWARWDQQNRGPEMARTAISGAALTTPLI